jgi:hypothetical protein
MLVELLNLQPDGFLILSAEVERIQACIR